MLSQVQTQNIPSTSVTDGTYPSHLGGKSGEGLVAQIHGRNYSTAVRGKVFHGISVPAGNSFPLYTATAFVFGVWNPLGSGVNLELIRFTAAYVSGTGVAGPFGYNFKPDAGSQAATGSPVAAFNHVALGIKNGILGGGETSKAQFTNAATNTVVAALTTNFIPNNMSHVVITAADATITPFMLEDNIDGSIIVPPGCLFWPAALLASVSLYEMKLTWAEYPV